MNDDLASIVEWHRIQAERWQADADRANDGTDRLTYVLLDSKAQWHRDCADHLERHGPRDAD